MKACKVIFVMFFLLMVIGLAAQENSQVRTLEDLYLSTEVEIQLLRSQAVSDHRDSKLAALATIRAMHENGRVSANEDAVLTILDSLSGEGVSKTVRSTGRIINNFPEIRRQAVYLLGDIGGARAEYIIYNILDNEPESMVLSEAVHALRRTSVSDTGRAALYITNILQVNTAQLAPDNNLAAACLQTILELGVVDANVLVEVINVANGSYITMVRQQAMDLLIQLRDGR